MGGFFGLIAGDDCSVELFYGVDYHSHLGNKRGGMLMLDEAGGFNRVIHDISNAPFRAKFSSDLPRLHGGSGIGCISDYEDQPLLIKGSMGRFGITTVGKVNNVQELQEEALLKKHAHFAESAGNELNPTEIVASLICEKDSFAEGIRYAQERIDGSCSMLLLAEEGVYAARDLVGRTPIVIGQRGNDYAAAFEACSLYNVGFRICRWLGPGETVLLTKSGIKDINHPLSRKKVCAFLWIYYGFPASSYEGVNVEAVRYRCGAKLAQRDKGLQIDSVSGVPDSGTAYALGFSHESGVPFRRSYIKYTPTWARSFLGDNQQARLHTAKMKLIPIQEFIKGKSLLYCEDSIVRGTQLKDTFARLPELGAAKIHVRSGCPPILFNCKFLNFSPSKSDLDLAARRAVKTLEGDENKNLDKYIDDTTPEYARLVEQIRQDMGFDTLKYQRLDDLLEAIGLPREQLCTYCWDGKE